MEVVVGARVVEANQEILQWYDATPYTYWQRSKARFMILQL